eukprot:COSAG01_NODE_4362_length_5097_cov_29.636455_6_plen_120_part_00
MLGVPPQQPCSQQGSRQQRAPLARERLVRARNWRYLVNIPKIRLNGCRFEFESSKIRVTIHHKARPAEPKRATSRHNLATRTHTLLISHTGCTRTCMLGGAAYEPEPEPELELEPLAKS